MGETEVRNLTAEAASENCSLKERYELTARSLTKMLRSLKLDFLSAPVYKGFPTMDDDSDVISVCSQPERKLSINAREFTPMVSSDSDAIAIVLTTSSDSEKHLTKRRGPSKSVIVPKKKRRRRRNRRRRRKTTC